MKTPIRVLIADDHPVLRSGIVRILAGEADFEVVGEARDGEEAIQKAKSLHPDVILMDLVMPGVDGIEATRRIRKQDKKIQILVFSGFASDERVFAAIKAGALGYLLKSCDPIELTEAIRRVGQGEPSLDPGIAFKILAEFSRAPHDPDAPGALSGREVEVLRLVAQGKSNREIGEDLHITQMTVRSHMSNILSKLHLASRTQAALYALREGIVTLSDVQVEEIA